MRTSRSATAVLLLLSAGLLPACGHKSVHAELVVPASPDRVWAVLTDTSSYGEWNPILVAAEGEFREGGTLVYQMKNPEGEISEVEPEVVTLISEQEINQFGGIRGILTFDHTWRLEPVDGATRVTQHEEYRGLYVWFWDPSWVEQAYRDSLVGLREQVAKRD